MHAALRPLLFILCAATLPAAAEDAPESKKCLWHWHHKSEFAWQVQANFPSKDLGRALDSRTGLGLGMQWTRDRGHGITNRTRLEWNVFPEGNPVGTDAIKTKASNYVLSFDRLYHFSGEDRGVYILGGLGAVRWFLDRTPVDGPRASSHTTKLAVTAGAGFRFNHAVAAEARYMVSTIDRTYDGNVLQASVSMRF